MKSTQSLTNVDLMEACQKPGCPVCRLEQEVVEQYLTNLFEKHFHRHDIRAQVRSSKGFCKGHAWQVSELGLGRTFGAVIYHDLLMIARDDLQNLERPPFKVRSTAVVD